MRHCLDRARYLLATETRHILFCPEAGSRRLAWAIPLLDRFHSVPCRLDLWRRSGSMDVCKSSRAFDSWFGTLPNLHFC
jgi:hypothetical protein